jgi:hypothetical protein
MIRELEPKSFRLVAWCLNQLRYTSSVWLEGAHRKRFRKATLFAKIPSGKMRKRRVNAVGIECRETGGLGGAIWRKRRLDVDLWSHKRRRFRGTCCIHPQATLKMELTLSLESLQRSTRHIEEDSHFIVKWKICVEKTVVFAGYLTHFL